jgi:hypothetical protein
LEEKYLNTLYREDVYKLEAEYCAARIALAADRQVSIANKMLEIRNQRFPDFDKYVQKSVPEILEYYNHIDLSSNLLEQLVSLNGSDLDDYTDQSFAIAKSYVSAKMGLDLDPVVEVKLSINYLRHAEAQCIACGESQHHVFYPTKSTATETLSTDLLCHEIGHAADFMSSRRANGGDDVLIQHKAINEMVAYYCQYAYLQEHGNRVKRMGALGAFIFTYLAALIVRYAIKKDLPLHKITFRHIMRDRAIEVFLKAYTANFRSEEKAKFFLSQKVEQILTDYQNIDAIVNHELSPRLGIPLALAALELSADSIKKVAEANKLKESLSSVIGLIPCSASKISELEVLMLNFINSSPSDSEISMA